MAKTKHEAISFEEFKHQKAEQSYQILGYNQAIDEKDLKKEYNELYPKEEVKEDKK